MSRPQETDDCLSLNGLRVMTLCGALPEEQTRAQPFELDVCIGVDLAPAGASDDLGDTIDYGGLCATVCATVESEQFVLMEALAERVAGVCLGLDPRARWVRVEVRKMRPPVPQHLTTSGVSITRSRQ